MERTAFTLENISKSYGDINVLNNISLEIPIGSIVSIIGRSGSGKTTLLRCMNCLEIPDSGKLSINSFDFDFSAYKSNNGRKAQEFEKNIFRLRSMVGMVFQNLNLFPHKTVLENISISPRIVKNSNKIIAENNANDILQKVGLGEYGNRYPHQLSGGQAQRVAIARALAMSPKILLYDEPTSALDPEITIDIISIMLTLQSEKMTQIIITHSPQIAKYISDIVIFLDKGQIVEIGRPDEIFENPKDDRTKQYIQIIGG